MIQLDLYPARLSGQHGVMKRPRSLSLGSLVWLVGTCLLAGSCLETRDDAPAPKDAEGSEVALEQGQSGSENVPDGYNPVSASWRPCPCGLQANAWLQATVLEIGSQRVELSLDEVLFGQADLQVGDSFSGEYLDTLFCGGTVCQNLAKGESVLASYRLKQPPKPPCAAYDNCLETCRAELSANAPSSEPVADTCPAPCEADTRDRCPETPSPDPSDATLGIIRWEDPLVLARTDLAEMTLPLERVNLLWADAAECDAEWEQPVFELDGYPTPYYSLETEELVSIPPEPECD